MKIIATTDELDKLIAGNFIKPSLENDEEYILTIHSLSGSEKIVRVTLDNNTFTKKGSIKTITKKIIEIGKGDHSNIEEWITSWRIMWKGKRVKAMGSKEKCKKNMKEFFKLFPEYTKEHVFKARDKYFDSLEGNMKYLEQADYFIKKRVPGEEGGVEVRRTLLTYCEEVVLDEEYGIDESFSAYDNV
jgi:hypothetical protein